MSNSLHTGLAPADAEALVARLTSLNIWRVKDMGTDTRDEYMVSHPGRTEFQKNVTYWVLFEEVGRV